MENPLWKETKVTDRFTDIRMNRESLTQECAAILVLTEVVQKQTDMLLIELDGLRKILNDEFTSKKVHGQFLIT